MTARSQATARVRELLDDADEHVMHATYYNPVREAEEAREGKPPFAPTSAPAGARPSTPPAPRPDHYKVICISMYNEDLARLDDIVKALKKRGLTRANRSAVLRAALEQMDPDRVQRGM